jgi:hypothetical protein
MKYNPRISTVGISVGLKALLTSALDYARCVDSPHVPFAYFREIRSLFSMGVSEISCGLTVNAASLALKSTALPAERGASYCHLTVYESLLFAVHQVLTLRACTNEHRERTPGAL